MVVRKETQQTGVIVNQSAQRHVSRGLRALSSIIAMVLTMALMLLYAPTPSARAMESTTSAESTDGMLSINSSTAVLTDTSGYHLNATVTNTTGQEIPAGTLTLAMNAFYTFVSRNDIQDWSEGNGRIPTPQSVGQADVPALQPGASTNVSIDADAHQESLAAINSWGPKPVLLSYSANGTPLAQSHTFVTRTGAGLHTPSTPALHITVAQPLAANGWTTDSKLLGQLVDEGGISSSKLAKIAMPSKDDDARLKSLQQTFAKHDMLQSCVEPGGPPHEGQYFAAVKSRPAIDCRLYVWHVFFYFTAIIRRVFVLLHTLIYRGNAGTNELCAFVFTCYTQIVQKVTNLSKK